MSPAPPIADAGSERAVLSWHAGHSAGRSDARGLLALGHAPSSVSEEKIQSVAAEEADCLGWDRTYYALGYGTALAEHRAPPLPLPRGPLYTAFEGMEEADARLLERLTAEKARAAK